MIRIGVCIPYYDLLQSYLDCIDAHIDPDIEFEVQHIIGIHEHLEQFVVNKDIVIARGITAATIKRRWPEKHLVEIELTGYDVLQAILEGKKKYEAQNIAIIYAETPRCNTAMLSEMTGIGVTVCKIQNDIDTASTIDFCVMKGIDVFVCGRTGQTICEEKGLSYVSINVGYEAVTRSVIDACTTAKTLHFERKKNVLIRELLNDTTDGQLVIDFEGKIIESNKAARTMLGESLKKLSEWKQVITTGSRIEVVRVIKDYPCVVRYSPVCHDSRIIGVSIVIQDSENIRESDFKIRRELIKTGLVPKYRFEDILGNSKVIQALINSAQKYSSVQSSVLITGETGTGKELFAHSIHSASPRTKDPFVAINCASLPENLLESELFGYVEGAFSGAAKGGKLGLFEIAHGGTIFLDEIGEMPISLQSKLLRVLQEKEIRRIGDTKVRYVDVRVIAATNVNIVEKINKLLFRPDLYYRLNVLNIHLPPLREHPEDIEILAHKFLTDLAFEMEYNIPLFSLKAKEILMMYQWPGNIRELKNVCEKIMVLYGDKAIVDEDEVVSVLPQKLYSTNETIPNLELLIQSGAIKKKALAEMLGISRTTLWRRTQQ